MAAGTEERDSWWCDVCEVDLKFQSRFDRHLKTSKHIALSGVRSGDDEAGEGDGNGVQVSESHHSMTFVSQQGDMEEMDHMLSPGDFGREENSDLDEGQQDEMQDEEEFDWGSLMDVDTASRDYSPFPSKLFALMFILLNSPRPLGESNLKFVWYMMKQLDSTIPSLTQVKSFTLPSLHSPIKYYTPQGVPFYINTPSETLRKCIGNPEIASMLQRYPVDLEPASVMRELWHGRRWRSDPLYQVPMVETEVSQVFVADFISTVDPNLGIILAKVLRFYQKEEFGDTFASVEVLLSVDQFCSVCPHANALYCAPEAVVQHDTHEVATSNITAVLHPPSVILQWDPSTYTLQRMSATDYSNYIEPHRLKVPALGRPIVIVPLIPYTDDTSGNKSKKWNKFDCWCFLCAGLPHHENAKLHNIHFITCSNEVSVLEMADPMVPDFLELEQGIDMYDAHLQRDVLVVAPILLFLGDNPRHSELLNHLGGRANKYCRMCLVDRNGSPSAIGALRTKELALIQMESIRQLRSESAKVAQRSQYGMKEDPNPLLTLSVDMFRSAPVETLHTILLGPYKYLLKVAMSSMNPRQKKEILARMAAFNYSGFDGKVLGNIIYHHQSFVGRDYKAWAQMAPHIIGSYLNDSQKRVWLGLSKVFRIVYCLPFSQQLADEYQQTCQEFLDTVQVCQPELLQKRKIHLLLHLVDNMIDFGPCCGFNTERCESFNGLMRTHNIYANRAAPSRDIAKSFAVIEQLRFLCSGGTVSSSESPAGAGLVQLFRSDAVQIFVNGATAKALHPEKAIYQAGTFRKKHETMALGDVQVPVGDTLDRLRAVLTSLSLNLPDDICLDSTVTVYGAVMSQQQQLVKPGNYIRYSDAEEQQYALLLACVAQDLQWYCIIRRLEVVSNWDEPITDDFDCPLLTLTNTVCLVLPNTIQVAVSIMHQCTNTCQFIETTMNRRIEREQVQVIDNRNLVFKHDWSNDLYCLNIYCMNQ